MYARGKTRPRRTDQGPHGRRLRSGWADRVTLQWSNAPIRRHPRPGGPRRAAREGVPPATSIAEIARRGPGPSADPVRVQGTVTYFDPTRRCLCLQDGGVGLFVHIPLDTRPLRPGQRAEVRGRVLAHNYLDATEARPVGDDALPDPIVVTGEQFVTRSSLNRRVALTGVVRAAGLEADRAIIHLMAGRTPVRVFVRDPGPGVPALDRLVDAEVRAVGVCGAAVDDRGLDGMKLLVQSLDEVAVLQGAPDRPFGLPLTALAAVPDWAEHRVRVAGEAAGPVADGVLTLRAGGRAVAVAVGDDVAARAGGRFEAVGFPGLRDGLPFLDDAVVRGFAPRRGVRPAEATPEDLLPVVRAVSELRRMSVDEVNRGYPVTLQATITFHDPRLHIMFVHDGTEGIFVHAPADLARQPAGRVVRLDGFTDPGDFAPMIHAGRVTPVRDGRLPAAPRYGYDELVGGRADSQWVEVEAVVRGAGRDSWGTACLLLRFGPVTVPAVVAATDPATLAGLFGATARVRASVGSTFNDRRQWSGLALYVPGPDAIEVRTPAPAGFADLPARTVESLSYFDPARGPGEPVKLRGTVIARRGSAVVFQDATGGITADLQPGQPGAVGEQVEIRGFLVRRGRPGRWRMARRARTARANPRRPAT